MMTRALAIGGLSLLTWSSQALAASPVPAAELAALLPTKLESMSQAGSDATTVAKPAEIAEAGVYFDGDDGSSLEGVRINIYLTDLVAAPENYKNFLAGRGLAQVSGAGSFDVEKADDFIDYLGIALPQSTGVGIINMGQESSSVLLSLSGVTMAREQGSILISQGSAIVTEIETEDDQGSILLNASEFELELAQGTSDDGSFVETHRNENYDVAGWDLFDATVNTGVIMVGVADRYGILIEGSGIETIEQLQQVLDQIDIGKLEEMAE